MPIGSRIDDDTALDSLYIIIVGIHEMHARNHESLVCISTVILASTGLFIEKSLDSLPELRQCQPFRSLALVEVLVGAAEQAELAEVIV